MMNKEESRSAIGKLGYHLVVPDKKQLSSKKIVELLDQLSDTDELRFIEGFPVILANCAHNGINVDVNSLLSRYKLSQQKRKTLEKLLLISSDLLNQEGLEAPEELGKIIGFLRERHGNLLDLKSLDLDKNRSISTARFRNAVRKYSLDIKKTESIKEKASKKQLNSFQLNLHLSTLFTPRQKELIFKKLNKKPFTKTEKEYFSRVIKKKLMVLTNNELRKIASLLIKKTTLD